MDEIERKGMPGDGQRSGPSERTRPDEGFDDRRPAVFGKRVLVADDCETNLALMTELLDQDRHQTAVARGGMQALEILCTRDFDVLFCAECLQDMTGAKLLQTYRFGKIDAAPGYLMSVAEAGWTAGSLQASGAAGVLHKPVASREVLREAIARVCTPDPAAAKGRPRTSNLGPAERSRPRLTLIAAQIIDPAVIEELRSVSTSREFLRELLVVAADDIGRITRELGQAQAERDFDRMRAQAHALKGVAASVGANRLAALATKLMNGSGGSPHLAMTLAQAEFAGLSQASVAALLEIAVNPAVLARAAQEVE